MVVHLPGLAVPVVLGRDFLARTGIVIDIANGEYREGLTAPLAPFAKVSELSEAPPAPNISSARGGNAEAAETIRSPAATRAGAEAIDLPRATRPKGASSTGAHRCRELARPREPSRARPTCVTRKGRVAAHAAPADSDRPEPAGEAEATRAKAGVRSRRMPFAPSLKLSLTQPNCGCPT